MNKKEAMELINSDLFRYTKKVSQKIMVKALLTKPGFRTTYFLRNSQYYKGRNKLKFMMHKFFLLQCKYKYGYEIPVPARFGKGIFINHMGNVIINPLAVIGDNFTTNGSLVIGQTNRGSKKGVPTLGNNVWVGNGAVIVGKINIGNNVMIAPNAYVNFDVPDNSVVIGNPGTIRQNENATDGYIEGIM
jgi:serine O-acetyltransferase